jgi:hypothetical protein
MTPVVDVFDRLEGCRIQGCGLFELIGELPKPHWYYSDYAIHITRQTIRMLKTVRLRLIASGVAELEATQRTADEVVAKRRAIARERRKARREAKYGPDASRFRHALPSAMRNGLQRQCVPSWELRIERYLQDQGYSRKEILEMIHVRRPKETTAERAMRKAGQRVARWAVARAERDALEIVRRWYGMSRGDGGTSTT